MEAALGFPLAVPQLPYLPGQTGQGEEGSASGYFCLLGKD